MKKEENMNQQLIYSTEPENKEAFTAEFDRMYTIFAGFYDFVVKVLPVWKNWLNHALPHIQGPKVLETSFGTGYLLTQYADKFDTYGIDYNEKFVTMATEKLQQKAINATLQKANIEDLPFDDETFDCIINTMAFTGYPDGEKAMAEIHRVLKPGGKFILVDVDYPANRNWLGMKLTRLWAALGDLIRDMDELFHQFNFEYTDEEIGGFGSVHLYVAEKKA
jgi:ubiquinone/menaquinone biosynthesis C-methylase UbiE